MYSTAKRITWVNGALIIINLIYFVFLEIGGSSEDTLHMLQQGAMYTPYILDRHEYYRFLTAMFMHFGISHLANNMLVLFVLGEHLERALGSAKYFVFYIICGIGANVISMAAGMNEPVYAVGAGASGAVFGVIGGLLYAVIVNKGRLEDLSTRQLMLVIVFSLYFGFASIDVDNVAHIAGLVIGIVLGAVMYRKPKRTPIQELWESHK
ncbi:MAG: rhomboid family intramembrane serine protease [Lachnospiraceae bacterium]